MNIYSYILFFTSLIMAFLSGMVVIPLLKQMKLKQTVREEGPDSHKKKNGTPTMGGIIFILSISVCSLIFLNISVKALYPLIALLCFSFIGFLDDYLKVVKGNNLGLRAKEKMALLIIFSVVLSIIAKNIYGSEIIIPFIKKSFDLGLWYIPFMTLIYISASNAVNLTDGLDGLASSVTVVVFMALSFIGYALGYTGIFTYSTIVVGSLVGFLIFNIHPAKVFMGDTGSLGLGGTLVATTIPMGMPLVILLLGIMYIIETLSVIIQVISFKTTGKRVFKMSPIHHHFELSGLTENKIVLLFTSITILFSIIAVLSI